ncbi:YbfB/YjiJ family MFS transporter [Humitalea sp. 24SJ18S-53]|uniref:YbfB/YjiJ family MFS transporter n=1 Tax=Humitalea sp. 24SJ18S-53 TaxID=3422307 RepID=UPI003D66E526
MTAPGPWLTLSLAGGVAVGSGIGLARFGFVPLFPAMVGAGWVDGAGAGLLGAANLAGYLAGALGAARLARAAGFRRTLDVAMFAAAAALLGCALPAGLGWFIVCRAVAGAAGGVLMALAGPAVQAAVETRHRGAASGVIIAGVGVGIVAVALLLPIFLRAGVGAGWAGLGLMALAGWAWARRHWPPEPPRADPVAPVVRATRLVIAYGLSGAGMVAPMIYMSDLAVRGRGFGIGMGSGVWLLFGLGAMAGTVLGGRAVDWLGAAVAVRLWLMVQVAALALALLPVGGVLALGGAAALSGFAGVGVSAVALAALRHQAGAGAAALWPRATAAYAVAQAIVAFALAALFAAVAEAHAPVFLAGLAFSCAALAVGWQSVAK